MSEETLAQYIRELEVTHRAWSTPIKHEIAKLVRSVCMAGAPTLPQKPSMFLNVAGSKTLVFCYWNLPPLYSFGIVRSDYGYSFGIFPSWQYGGIAEPSEVILAANAILWTHGVARTPDGKYTWKLRDQSMFLHRDTLIDSATIRRHMTELSRKDYRKFRFVQGQWQRYHDPLNTNRYDWHNILLT